MINSNSDLYRNHPEFALGNSNYDRSLSRHQLVLDTSNDYAVEVIFEAMCKILDKYDIYYVKWDHNRCIAEIQSASKYQETYHKLVLGYYKLLRKLQERYPNILFEGCASGGGRFDLGQLYFTPQIWTSDETDPIQRLFIQYSTSYMYPLSSMGSHISKSKMTNYRTKGNIALFGTYGFEMNPCLLKEEERQEIRDVTDVYHKFHNEVIQNGDLYRLYSPFETNYMSMMSVSKDKSKAIVLFANLLKENNHYRFLKLQGLDSNKIYRNNFDNKAYSGEYYMNIGINLSRWLDEFSSFLITLEEI
jgi:alpha-galactosidase